MFPLVFLFPFFAGVAGGFVSKVGRYRPVHLLGFVILSISLGCCSLLDANSSTAEWVILETLVAIGLGMVTTTLLPAVQAELDDSSTASSTATWAFIRSFGVIWGVSIPTTIFNNRFQQLLYLIEDPSVRAQLGRGQAYEHASKIFIESFQEPTRSQLINVYTQSLKFTWQLAVIFAGICFIAALFEKEVKLRTHLETEYGMEKREKKSKDTPSEKEGGKEQII